jgi:hypothetical protein
MEVFWSTDKMQNISHKTPPFLKTKPMTMTVQMVNYSHFCYECIKIQKNKTMGKSKVYKDTHDQIQISLKCKYTSVTGNLVI